jgi:hypothetical protein
VNIKTLVSWLLFAEVASFLLILLVIGQQLRLLRFPAARYTILSRRVLMVMSIAALISTAIVIVIDVATLNGEFTNRAQHVPLVSVFYTSAKTLGSMFMAAGIWLLYYFARKAYEQEREGRADLRKTRNDIMNNVNKET